MTNPYYIYIISFLFSLLVYALGWSDLFPILKTNVIIFLFITFIAALTAGFVFQKKRFLQNIKIEYNSKLLGIVSFIIFLWVIEFANNRGIPLILILGGQEFDYMKFGIPTLHVFIVTFTSFFSIFLFHVYLSTKKKKALIYYCILMIMPLLLFNRGMFLINVVSSVFVYLQFVKRVSMKRLLALGVFSIIVLYLFGVLGNIRSTKAQRPDSLVSSEYVLGIGGANPDFVNSPIPKEFFWSYLYIASPIGNFQFNIDSKNKRELSLRNFILFTDNEFIFDFISKRFDVLFEEERETCIKFIESLSVATVYTNSFIYFGWAGLIIMSFFIIAFPIFYLGLIRKNNTFYVASTSILCSLYLFLIFDNMFAFTGLSFQLVYPLVFNRIYNLKFKL